MQLNKDEEKSFLKEFKQLVDEKRISEYAIREIDGMYRANKKFDNENYNCCDRKLNLLCEFMRIKEVIKSHPNLRERYNNLENQVLELKILEDNILKFPATFVTKEADMDFLTREETIMEEIIRLQAALGLDICLKHINYIDNIFDKMYLEIMNGKYEDSYHNIECKVERMAIDKNPKKMYNRVMIIGLK